MVIATITIGYEIKGKILTVGNQSEELDGSNGLLQWVQAVGGHAVLPLPEPLVQVSLAIRKETVDALPEAGREGLELA